MQVGLDAPFQRGEAQFFEAPDLALSKRVVGDFGKRRAAPERECLAEHFRSGRRVAALERALALLDTRLEDVPAQLPRRDAEQVAAGRGLQPRLARRDLAVERLAQPGDRDAQSFQRAPRILVTPQRLDELI